MSHPRSAKTALRLVSVCALTLLIGAAAAPAETKSTPARQLAAGAPQASTSTATFEDWQVRCESRPPAPKICEIAQVLAARGANQRQSAIAEIVFGRLGKSDPMKLVVQLPAGVWLPSGVSFALGDSLAVELTYTRCAQSCIAEVELKPDFVQALRGWTKADPARLAFADGAQRKVALNVSLKGLPAALAARDEQAAQ